MPSKAISRPPSARRYGRTRHFVWLATGFWRRRESLSCWLLLAGLVALQFAIVSLNVWQNNWDRQLGDALQQRNADAITGLIAAFFLILALTAGSTVGNTLLLDIVALRWRAWLTQNYTTRWLEQTRFLRIERSALVDNPDQRMTEDIILFTQPILSTAMGALYTVTSVWAFVGILWGLSSTFDLAIGPIQMAVPGDLVWISVLYMLVGSWCIVRLGRPLIKKTMRQQHVEADFRFRLIDIRRNAEQIAFARAAQGEIGRLGCSFADVYSNGFALIRANLAVSIGQSTYSGVETILPLLLILPRFFAGAMTLGGLMAVRSAFSQLTTSLSWFIQVYPSLAQLAAIAARLKAFDDALASPSASTIRIEAAIGGIRADGLDLSRPSGETLLRVQEWRVATGERWMIRGASGTGKSTLLRALAGLWPHGTGVVHLPNDAATMFVPQKPYMPLGSLREALAFPDEAERHTPDACRHALEAARLPRLIDELAVTRAWNDELSPGEQQRLAFARIVLRRPAILFLDEATSALDPETAAALYDMMLAALPNLTLVSVIHADFLASRHAKLLSIVDGVATPSAWHGPLPNPDRAGLTQTETIA